MIKIHQKQILESRDTKQVVPADKIESKTSMSKNQTTKKRYFYDSSNFFRCGYMTLHVDFTHI